MVWVGIVSIGRVVSIVEVVHKTSIIYWFHLPLYLFYITTTIKYIAHVCPEYWRRLAYSNARRSRARSADCWSIAVPFTERISSTTYSLYTSGISSGSISSTQTSRPSSTPPSPENSLWIHRIPRPCVTCIGNNELDKSGGNRYLLQYLFWE